MLMVSVSADVPCPPNAPHQPRRTRRCDVSQPVARRRLHADVRRRLFLPRIVRWIDVGDTPRSYTVHLNDRLVLRPAEVVRLWLHDGDASSRQAFALGLIELVADAEIKRAGTHRDVLDRR